MRGLRRLIVGIDFSPRSISAAELAVDLARPSSAEIDLVHVSELQITESDAAFLGKNVSYLENMIVGEAQSAIDDLAAQFEYSRISQKVIIGSPAKELTRYTIDHDADILIVGDTGTHSAEPSRGVGVNAYRLVEHGPRKVLVVNASCTGKIKSVAAAISFVPVADELMRQAHLLASTAKATLHVVHAIPDITEMRFRLAFAQTAIERALSESQQYNEKRLDEFVDQYDIYDVVVKKAVLAGNPGAMLIKYLQEENIDVVVLGTGTAIRIAGYPIGSTTHTVLNRTLSSVLVVRSLESSP